MQLLKSDEAGGLNVEMNDKKLYTYSKPTMFKLGTITDLTTGGSGNLGDVTGKTTPGPIRY